MITPCACGTLLLPACCAHLRDIIRRSEVSLSAPTVLPSRPGPMTKLCARGTSLPLVPFIPIRDTTDGVHRLHLVPVVLSSRLRPVSGQYTSGTSIGDVRSDPSRFLS